MHKHKHTQVVVRPWYNHRSAPWSFMRMKSLLIQTPQLVLTSALTVVMAMMVVMAVAMAMAVVAVVAVEVAAVRPWREPCTSDGPGRRPRYKSPNLPQLARRTIG